MGNQSRLVAPTNPSAIHSPSPVPVTMPMMPKYNGNWTKMPEAPRMASSNALRNSRTDRCAISAPPSKTMLIQSGVMNFNSCQGAPLPAHQTAPATHAIPVTTESPRPRSRRSAKPSPISSDVDVGSSEAFNGISVDCAVTLLPSHMNRKTVVKNTAAVSIRLQLLNTVSRSPMDTGKSEAQGAFPTNSFKCPTSATFSGADPLNPPCQTSIPE